MTSSEPIRLFSHSESWTWRRCHRRWFLQWFVGLASPIERVDNEAATGSRVHAALAVFYTPGQVRTLEERIGDAMAELHRVQQEAMAVLVGDRADDGLTVDQTKLVSHFDLERRMVEGYFEWLQETGADTDLDIVAAEEEVRTEPYDFEGARIALVGRLDIRARSRQSGFLAFLDTKTVDNFSQPMIQQETQMLHYRLLEKMTKQGEHVMTVFWNMLRKVKRTAQAKPPFYDRVEIVINDEQLRSYWTELHGVIHEVLDAERRLRAGVDHRFVVYPNPNNDCSWQCPYTSICPLMDDGSRWLDLAQRVYVIKPPYSRYDIVRGTEPEPVGESA